MDISQWPMNEIMALPDSAFGRKWCVAVTLELLTLTTGYVIGRDSLPDRAVVWSVWLMATYGGWAPARVAYRLGNVVPTNQATFESNETLFGSINGIGQRRSDLINAGMGMGLVIPMRLDVLSAGKRLVCEIYNASASTTSIQAGIVISSIPREVPDWLISGPARIL